MATATARVQDQAGTTLHLQETTSQETARNKTVTKVVSRALTPRSEQEENPALTIKVQHIKADPQVPDVVRKNISKQVAECVFQTELENMKSASKGTTGRINKVKTVTFVGGDIFSALFLILQGIKPFIMPSIAAAGASGPLGLGIALCVCGVIGGALTTVVGGLDMKAGYDTLKKCHSQYEKNHEISWESLFLGIRLMVGGFFEIVVGAMLIVIPIVLMVAAGGAFGVFIAANPWLLPLLFVIPTLCYAFELVPKIYRMIKQTTLPQLLNVNDLFKSLDFDKTKSNGLLQTWKDQFTTQVINSLAENARKNRKEQALKTTERLLAKKNKGQKLEENEETELAKNQEIPNKSDIELDDIIKQEAIESEKQKARNVITDLEKKTIITTKEASTLANNRKLLTMDDEELYHRIQHTTIMSHLELEMGIEGALAAFDLYRSDKTQAESLRTEISTLNDKSNEWIRVQKIKITIQAIYLVSFIISMATLGVPAGRTADIMNAVINGGLAVANGLPGYLDAFKKFLRGTPLTTDELTVVQTMDIPLTNFAAEEPEAHEKAE